MSIFNLNKKEDVFPHIISEGENYIIFGGYSFSSASETIKIAEYLLGEGFKVLSIGDNGVLCEKLTK